MERKLVSGFFNPEIAFNHKQKTMKLIRYIICAMVLIPFAASSQPAISKERFKAGLRAIIDDAATGFHNSQGSMTSDSKYGTQYTSRLNLPGGSASGYLFYLKTFTGTEDFYYTQYFSDTSAAGKFVTENAEDILDELAKEYHWKKSFKDQKSEKYRRETRSEKYKIKQYRQWVTEKATITWSMPEAVNLTIDIHSPYRPSDAPTPDLLGCMVYSYSNSNFRYVVPVHGASLGDKAKVAADAYSRSGLSESSYQYEWMPGESSGGVSAKFGSGFSVKVLSDFRVE